MSNFTTWNCSRNGCRYRNRVIQSYASEISLYHILELKAYQRIVQIIHWTNWSSLHLRIQEILYMWQFFRK